MKIKLYIFLAVIVLLGSCASGTEKSTKTGKKIVGTKKSINSIKPLASMPANGTKLKDTLFINSKSAISFWIDSVEMAKRQKKEGDDFATGADDYANYAEMANSFLQKKNLPIVKADGSKYLKFLQSNGTITFIKTDTLPMLNTWYFFDPKTKPYNADVTIIEDEYKKFFRR